MSDVVDLDAHRWKSGTDADRYKPREAIAAALRQIDEGRFDPQHAIVCFGMVKDGVTQWHITQGGSFDDFAQVGMLTQIAGQLGRG